MDRGQIAEWRNAWLNKNLTEPPRKGTVDMLTDFYNEFVPKWVSVESGGYQYYKIYSVYDSESDTTYQAWPAYSGELEEDIWTVDKSDIVLANVTHWQPLPPPPTK